MNYKKHFSLIVGLILATVFGNNSFSQSTEGSIPPSFNQQGITTVFDTRDLPAPDMQKILQQDQENRESQFPAPERMAVAVPVNMDMNNSGTWTDLPDGSGKIWRLKLSVEGALALGVYYDHFYLPPGAKLYLYNENKTQLCGAYTSAINPASDLFATEFVQGQTVTLEYYQPIEVQEDARISISNLAYAYRDISFNNIEATRDASWPCMINVKCDEGIGWEDQVNGVARISIKIGFSYYWCSGSMINNTSNNRVPYFLTASHCGEGSNASDMNQWIFYFNYESALCIGNYGPSNHTVTGCALKANDPSFADAGSDFYLVQLNSTPPSSYNVYYNGWNRTNVPADSGVGIHHPAGDIKKISTYKTPLVSSTWWNGLPSHWRLNWSPTVNGLSIMQGGSSGSPVFDQDGHIVGDLTGGYQSNSCSSPSPAWYGKIWYSWDQNGSTPSTRLKDWLDPTNTGIEKMPGLSSQILPPVADFSADNTTIPQGESVQFTDETTGNPVLSWNWTFEGGIPASSTEQNPVVEYPDFGTFDVTLEVTNADGTDTEIKTNYMTITEVLPPVPDFEADNVEITEGETINFTDLSTNSPYAWEWSFDGAVPSTDTVQNPENILYDTPGFYDVSMTATNAGGSATEIKSGYITVIAGALPVADFIADKTQIMVGDTVNFTDLSSGDPTKWIWDFYGGTPSGSSSQNPSNIVYDQEGTYDVQLLVKNAYGSNTVLKTGYIVVGQVKVPEYNRNNGLVIFPNPSNGKFKLYMQDIRNDKVNISITNAVGKIVSEEEMPGNVRSFDMDLTGFENGLYFIRIQDGKRTINKKISIIK